MADLRQLFCDDAIIDSSETLVDPWGVWHGGTLPVLTPDDVTSGLADRMSDAATVHHGHMAEISVHDTKHAEGIWAMEDIVRRRPGSVLPSWHGYGHYRERYRRDAGQWRIAAMRITRLHIAPIAGLPEPYGRSPS